MEEFKTEDVAGGRLACAKVVTWILREAKLIDWLEISVDKTVERLKNEGWKETRTPHIGGVVVWDKTKSFPNKHIGIVMGENQALNNSSFELKPIISPIFKEERKVIAFLKPPQKNNTKTNVSNNIKPAGNSPAPTNKKKPEFKKWKGEIANQMLDEFWIASGGDWDFIKTMAGENGSFNPYLKHPVKNKNGTQDYSFGLNDFAGNNSKMAVERRAFIEKILTKKASFKEIAEYHYDVYKNGGRTNCGGPTPFCAYPKRNSTKIKALFK